MESPPEKRIRNWNLHQAQPQYHSPPIAHESSAGLSHIHTEIPLEIPAAVIRYITLNLNHPQRLIISFRAECPGLRKSGEDNCGKWSFCEIECLVCLAVILILVFSPTLKWSVYNLLVEYRKERRNPSCLCPSARTNESKWNWKKKWNT